MAKKETKTSLLAYLGILNRPGSSVSKKKQSILKEAIEGQGGLNELDKAKTPATKDVQNQVEFESDIDKARRERARKARQEMTLLNGKK